MEYGFEKKIRKAIFSQVKALYALRKSRQEFIPFKSKIPYAGRVYDEKEMISLVDASLDFWLTYGRYAKSLEEQISKFLGMKFCILANSGSSANLLAVSSLTSPELKARRLKKGDEVITTACAFPTTLNPIIQNGLVPVFIDIELGTYNIDASKIKKAIKKNTKAILIAHTLGNPADLGEISRIADKYGLWLIEDNSDALGAEYAGRHTGSFGHISTLSFYPAHHITTGEGGAVLTNEPLLKKIIQSFRDWGRDCFCEPGYDNTCKKRFTQKFSGLPFGYDHKYVYSHIGYNFKLTDMQAAIGFQQFKKLPRFIQKRRDNFNRLYGILKEFDRYILLPQATHNSNPSWFGFPILIKEGSPFNRNDIVNYLEKNKIATRMLFGGNLIKQPAYIGIKYRVYGGLENTNLAMNNLFWIGVYPGIGKDQINFIAERFISLFRQKR